MFVTHAYILIDICSDVKIDMMIWEGVVILRDVKMMPSRNIVPAKDMLAK